MVATTWNPSDLVADGMTLSNSNLTAASVTGGPTLGIAVDLTNSKMWIWSPFTRLWNNTALASSNPATNTGGVSLSSVGTTLFAAFSGYFGSAGGDVCVVNFGATQFSQVMPSGFSTYNSIAGATCTWSTSDKDSAITLSNGNMTATQTGASSSWRSIRASNSIASGKAYFEITANKWDTANGFIFGVAKSTAALNTYIGSTSSTGIGFQSQGSSYGAGGVGIGAYNGNDFWRCVRGTVGRNTGKVYFEITCSAVDASSYFRFGLAPATFHLGTYYPGETADTIGSGPSDTVRINTITVATATFTTSGVTGVAVDFGNKKAWFYSSTNSNWNNLAIGSSNPATNTGGIDITALVGVVLYPLFSAFKSGNTAIANFGASAFAHSAPSGFASWDAGTVDTLGPSQFLIT